MDYKPRPIDTSKISLSESVMELAELLAKNTHDVWAQERMAQGWRYGARRDDEAKEHPCLVPYEQLPESEKVYDRSSSMEALKVICSMGYDIVKKEKTALILERDGAKP